MIAFLKRRWFLLACAVGLLPCTILNFAIIDWPDSASLSGSGWSLCFQHGALLAMHGDESVLVGIVYNPLPPEFSSDLPGRLQPPSLGTFPVFRSLSGSFLAVIPIWLMLAVILGWLVFRELRWREKRAKAAEAVE